MFGEWWTCFLSNIVFLCPHQLNMKTRFHETEYVRNSKENDNFEIQHEFAVSTKWTFTVWINTEHDWVSFVCVSPMLDLSLKQMLCFYFISQLLNWFVHANALDLHSINHKFIRFRGNRTELCAEYCVSERAGARAYARSLVCLSRTCWTFDFLFMLPGRLIKTQKKNTHKTNIRLNWKTKSVEITFTGIFYYKVFRLGANVRTHTHTLELCNRTVYSI